MEGLAPLALDLNCQTQYRRCLKEGIQCHARMEELLHLKRTDPPCGTSPSSHHCHITKNQDDLLQLLGMHCWWCVMNHNICVTCHTCHTSVTDFRPRSGNPMEVTLMTP